MTTAVSSTISGAASEKKHLSIRQLLYPSRSTSGIYLLLLLAAVLPARIQAQTFASIPALNFSMAAGGGNPLPQVITVTSTGANFNFFAAVSTSSGGNWLQINPSSYGAYGISTPQAVTVSAVPDASLAAGSYSGQILLTAGSNTMTIPVTLIVHPATTTFFDQVAGGLTFTLQTNGKNPPGQTLEVRNAGTGTLSWHSTTSTADGGSWLSVSPAAGTAPSTITISIQISKLPNAGLIAGTFTGQVALSAAGDKVTIPITVVVNDSTFYQINPLSFAKTYTDQDPLPQVITVASTDANFSVFGSAVSSTGGDWLQISPSSYGAYGISTPQAITVSAHPTVTLAAGTYMGQVTFKSANGAQVLTIPVTLKISPNTTPHFDDVAGAAEFSMATSNSTGPPPQELRIRNAGSGTLTWAAATTTADGGDWLKVSAANGTAPAPLSVSVVPANLPGGGLIAGMFVGQVVLSSSAGRITVPVTMDVGAAVFRQINPLSFTQTYAEPNPLPQTITVSSTGANFSFFASAVSFSGTPGWLKISPNNYGAYGISTPETVTVSVTPPVSQPAGAYTGEILLVSSDGKQSMTVPVTLTIASGTGPAYFDTLPGQITFSMQTSGSAPPPQAIDIRNAGTGVLNWTASTSTSDGGAWLKAAPASGTAPSSLSVSIIKGNLPGGGLTAGTFTGQVVLKTAGDEVTIPVTVTVGSAVFRQINALYFTKAYTGANPLPQMITVSSTGAGIAFFASVTTSTGGNWLQISPSNYGAYGISTPQVLTVTANPDVTLEAGTYTGQIIIVSANGGQALTVPVSLTIAPQSTAFFDALPGQVSFTMQTGGSAPPAQPLEIRNAGSGTLNWTASASTSDGGAWLKVTPASGRAPSVASVIVVPANFPGGGLVAGTFSGQVILKTAGDEVSIPVTVAVGDPVFRQINALDFTKVYSGPNPLPQIIEVATTSTNLNFFASVMNSTGGNWLQISPSNYGAYGIATPEVITVSVNPAVTLPAGTYTAEIYILGSGGGQSLTVPVTLTISPASATFFDDLPGGVDFFQAIGAATPAPQSVPIRNAGAGTLNWTASASTADGHNWLKINATAGSAPSTLSVSVVPGNLPGGGLTAGTFVGQILLVTNGDRETIPVNYRLDTDVLQQLTPLSFSKPYGGSNPLPQTITVAVTGANVAVFGSVATSTGNGWLQISPSNYGAYGINTPVVVTVSVNPVATLPVGEYLGEIFFESSSGGGMVIVPVTLTITSSTPTSTPAFSPPAGTYSSAQTVTIIDSTKGSAIYYTTDGSTPTTSSKRYSVPVTVTATETIKAIATAPGQPQSAVASATYTITAQKAAEPAATSLITITDATSGATVYYTTDGSTPTTSSNVYTAPILLQTGAVLKFIAVAPGYSPSDVRTVTTTIQ